MRSLVQIVADSSPAFRSTTMCTSRPVRSTRARSSPTPLSRHTITPLIETSIVAGSKAALVVPAAARMRPQLGSLPKMAHLKRLLRAIARPTSRASDSVAAESISMRMSCAAPSASRISCSARSAHTSVNAASRSAGATGTADAPEASAITVSLVDIQPSESIRSKVLAVAARSAASRSAGATWASVVSTTSMVAKAGASMPAPLAMPPTLHPGPEYAAVLATVSVVMIASAAAGPPSPDSSPATWAHPARSVSMGSSSPIMPVEQTATSPAEMPSNSATTSAVLWVSWNPCGPVQALAPPELRMTASTRWSASTCRDQITGAAWTRFVVKTAAAQRSGPSLTTSARSGRPLAFSPAVMPAARNPVGVVTDIGRAPGRDSRGHTDQRQAGEFGQAEGEVQALHGGAGGALGEIVDRRDGDQPTLPRIHGDLQVHRVGAEDIAGARPDAVLEQDDARLAFVCRGIGLAQLPGARAGGQSRGGGGQDAPGHGREGGRERDTRGRPCGSREVLLDLRRMPVPTPDAVGRHGPHHLGAEEMWFAGFARSRGAGGCDDDDVRGVEEAGAQAGCEGQADAGRIAAGNGDPLRAGEQIALVAFCEREFRKAVGPGPGIRRVVEGGPVPLVLEAEVGAAVDDDDLVGQLRGQRRAVAVREGEEDDVVPGQHLCRGVLEQAVAQRRQVRVDRAQGLPGVAARRQRPDLHLGVREQQADELASRIPTRTRDRDPYRHVHDYTFKDKIMQNPSGQECTTRREENSLRRVVRFRLWGCRG
ncbi:hypothetical protein BN11_110027 [Nostocoides australiense Ben110]|uniref:Uncharacterized protein n=1 Tax=Nostocoides australiense Ben110 TaxID=1193182 RepID=W6JSY3_9MICO|nr:hypothetical protein BN11_110027 [Tetrasphaera australiensis Ben110]